MPDHATLCATSGEPVVTTEWLRNYAAHRAQLGRLYLQIGWRWPADVMEMLERRAREAGGDDAVVLHPPETGRYDHGQGMDRLIEVCEEPYVQFTEEDVLVRDSNLIRYCFQEVAAQPGTICGVPRTCASEEILLRSDDGEPGMWPHLLFGELSAFRDLTERCGARIWEVGEPIKGLGHSFSESVTADTFGAAAMELRAVASRLIKISSPTARDNISGSTFHVGSVSTGPLGDDARPVRPEGVAWDWDYRIAWWKLCAERWQEDDLAADYMARYRASVGVCKSLCPLGPYGGTKPAYDRLKQAINW